MQSQSLLKKKKNLSTRPIHNCDSKSCIISDQNMLETLH